MLLTNQIFSSILAQLRQDSLFEGSTIPGSAEYRLKLETLFQALLPGLATLPIDSVQITDLLSLIDHAVIQANPIALHTKRAYAGGWSFPADDTGVPYQAAQELGNLRALLDRAILSVLQTRYSLADGPAYWEQLEHSEATAADQAAGRPLLDQNVLDLFAKWIAYLANSCDTLSIVTTNYDLIPEEICKRIQIGGLELPAENVDFGFPWRDAEDGSIHFRPSGAKLGIYKLHGSLNWLQCALCEHIYINPVGEIAALGFDPTPKGFNTCHCSYWPLKQVIVAPSMVRDIRDPNIRQIWMAALEALRLADEWVAIGYSMPAEDIAIRSLLIRGFRARGYEKGLALRPHPKISVVQMDDHSVLPYRLLFGDVIPELGGLTAFLERQQASGVF